MFLGINTKEVLHHTDTSIQNSSAMYQNPSQNELQLKTRISVRKNFAHTLDFQETNSTKFMKHFQNIYCTVKKILVVPNQKNIL